MFKNYVESSTTSIYLFILVLILLEIGCTKEKVAATIPLNIGWKFKIGDSLKWAQPEFKDDLWDYFSIGNRSVNANEVFNNYDGYAWYRIKVFIPSSLRSSAYLGDSLKIYLGAIDDCDQIYLNGQLIGENTKVKFASIAPQNTFIETTGIWDKERKYILSSSDKRILWDKENLIAVRIFDQKGGGGMSTEPKFLGMTSLYDYLLLDTKSFYKFKNDSVVDRIIVLRNTSKVYPIKGNLFVLAENMESQTNDFKHDYDLNIKPGRTDTLLIYLPVSTDSLKVTFEIRDHLSDMLATFTDSIPYNLANDWILSDFKKN